MVTEKTAKLSKFTEILKKFVKYKNDYEKLLKEGGLNKELNLSYKKKFADYDIRIKEAYEELKIRKNKFNIDNYTIELYRRPVNKALTLESLGKWIYKFFYINTIINDNADSDESKKKIKLSN